MADLSLLKKGKEKKATGFKLNMPTKEKANVPAPKPETPTETVASDTENISQAPAVETPPVNPLKNALAGLAKAGTAPRPKPTTIPASTPESLENLAGIDMDTIAEVKPAPTSDAPNLANYMYDGQAETAEARATESFREQLAILEQSLGTAFTQDNITIILKYIDEHTFLKDILKPEDIGIMVKGLRDSYGVAITAKAARTKKQSKKQEQVADVLDILTDISI